MDIEKTEQEPKRVRKFNRILLGSVLLVTVGVLLGMSIDWFVDEKSPYRNIGSDEEKQRSQLQATLNEHLETINQEITDMKSYMDERERIVNMPLDEPEDLDRWENLRNKYEKQLKRLDKDKGELGKIQQETEELAEEYHDLLEEKGSM